MRALITIFLFIVGCSSTPALAQSADIKIVLVGDVMLADGPGRLIRAGQDPFRYVAAALKGADMTIGNLECVIASTGKPEPKPYTFRAPKQSLRLLKKYFSAVSLANNHSGDFGKAAFSEMLQLLEQHQIPYFGGGRNLRAAHQAYIQEIRGKRIAVLGFNGFFPRSFEALDDAPGIAWLDEDRVAESIQHTKQKLGVDFLIVYPHWGWEYQKLASTRQRQMARLMIDSGADAVVGGHPHVTQDIEVYQGKPIFYSLGNFVFDGFSDRDTRTGWLLELSLKQAGGVSWRVNEVSIDAKGVPRLSGRVEQTATIDPQ
ncbi:MAG: CapA family protein [Burkholderiaceae bacterium]|nr:CapA family protein [Burkholderiaceae bacterium]